MTAIRCGLVEPFFRGFTWVKYVDEPAPHKLWHTERRQCPNEATQTTEDRGLTFRRCERHARAT